MTYHKKNLSFFKFSFFNILEKLLAYVSPFLILKFIGDPLLYNKIELIYSISIIINVFIDFGIKGHFVYSYRFYESKKEHENIYLQSYNILILYYLIFAGFIALLLNFFHYSSLLIVLLIFIRVFYLLIINFYKFFFRFYYNINYFFLLTLPVNIVTILLILFLKKNEINYIIIYFFISQLALVFFYTLFFVIRGNFTFRLKNFLKVIGQSLNYYWPIILSSAISIIIMNFGKIYSYYNLPQSDMTKFSLILRFLLMIQLFHATFSGYFLKKNYKYNQRIIYKNVTILYLTGLLISTIISSIMYPLLLSTINLNYNFDKVYFLLMIYILFWCISSYLEQFLGKFNKNLYLMYLQLISILIYFIPLIYLNNVNIYHISFSMTLSSLFYLLGILFFLKKEGIKIK